MERRRTRWNGEEPDGTERELKEWRLEGTERGSPSFPVPLRAVPSLSVPSRPSNRRFYNFPVHFETFSKLFEKVTIFYHMSLDLVIRVTSAKRVPNVLRIDKPR